VAHLLFSSFSSSFARSPIFPSLNSFFPHFSFFVVIPRMAGVDEVRICVVLDRLRDSSGSSAHLRALCGKKREAQRPHQC
jgi:hypothetical protein